MTSKSEWRRQDLVNVQGVPMFCAFAQNLEDIIDHFQARDDDIVIDTYPKSGTTWMSEIVDLVLHDGNVDKSQRDAIFIKVPMLEFRIPGEVPPVLIEHVREALETSGGHDDVTWSSDEILGKLRIQKSCENVLLAAFGGSEILQSVPSPRVIKTHLPVRLFPKSLWEKNVKIIYVARNPKDTAVSFYHFDTMNQLHPHPGTWDEYVERFMAGNVGFGSWGAHVREWWNLRQQKNILYVFYEDMLEDPRREIQKVVKFLGKDFSEEVVDRVCQHTSFTAMKENPLTNYTALSSTIMDQSISPFMRKGICGDWKNHFTVAQSERFDEYYRREMSGTDLTFRF